MKSNLLKITAALLALATLISSCASSTLITTNYDDQGGAKLYLDGASVGSTPYTMSDTKIMGSTTTISLKRDDCETLNTSISRMEQADVGAIIGGCFVWIPFLWSMKYNPYHHYEMETAKQIIKNNPSNNNNNNNNNNSYEKLKELKNLLDEGIITEDEFKSEKGKILEK